MTDVLEKIQIANVTIGSDIEWFLQNKDNEEIVSAEGLILGTKDQPHHFDKDNDYYATSLDCVAAEGNIPPCKTAGEYYQAIQHLLRYINSAIPQNLQTLAIPSARLDDKYLQSEVAKTYGCSPAYNIWDMSEIRPIPDGSNNRVIGKHIHIGYDNPNMPTNIELGKAMDLFLGVPSILIEPDNERRSSGYGLAGSCRFPKFGLEYRTLSSYFAANKELIEWCFNNTQAAIDFVNKGNSRFISNLGYDLQDCINLTDKKAAERFIQEFEIQLP